MKSKKLIATILLLTLCLSVAIRQVQAQQPASASSKTDSSADAVSRVNSSTLLARVWPGRRAGFSLMASNVYVSASGSGLAVTTAAAGPPAVHGGGTVGKISMWVGTHPSGNSTLGDSIVTQLNGNIGIGLATPTSKLTVQGMIETTLGGYKFPDGTIQTTAALSGLTSIFHDATLTGNGTSGSLLGIAPGGVGTNQLANNAVTAAKIANGTLVRSLNGLLDNVTLAEGANITITTSGNTLTIAAPNSLNVVSHDTTLTGSGESGSSLGVAVPLNLTGGVQFQAVIKATSTTMNGIGVTGIGSLGGVGVRAVGGNSNVNGGTGVTAFGGQANSGFGGNGVFAGGGPSDASGGYGVVALGGRGESFSGGIGVQARGGDSGSNFGGVGVQTMGGTGAGAGKSGGDGIVALGGVGQDGAVNGFAGNFQGNMLVIGNLSKGGGSFKIDHPLDPANKYLYHSFVESPDMKNIYDGTVTTDANGDATVTLPDYFAVLNRDFCYQLTVIGTFAQAIVAEEIRDNRFTIKTSAANAKVSWQVTGIRRDAYANKNRIQVEEDKTERERGFYLHPEAFNQPEERGVEWARQPEMMRQMKETRLKQLEELKQKAPINDR